MFHVEVYIHQLQVLHLAVATDTVEQRSILTVRIIRNDGQPRDAVSLSVEGALVTVFRSGAITYRCPLLARQVDVGSQGAVDAEVALCGFRPC